MNAGTTLNKLPRSTSCGPSERNRSPLVTLVRRLVTVATLAVAALAWPVHAAPASTTNAPLTNVADSPTASEPAADGDALRISLVTFGPGRVYWERFGHDAIVVENVATGVAIAYNYGIFDFSQKNFFLNFALGNMRYRMAADPYAADLAFYAASGRSVTQQTLNLTPAQRVSLARFLEWNVLPANAGYRYDYFLSNCSTRVRDALDRALGGVLETQLAALPAAAGRTYRFDAVRALSPDAWLAMAMDVALGPSADKPLNLWQESFLPQELNHALEKVQVTGAQGQRVPLVTSTRVLVQGTVRAMPTQPPDWLPLLLAIGLGIAITLLLLHLARRVRAARVAFAVLATSVSLCIGLGGVVLALIWAITQHWAGWHNENLLLFDPLCLLLLPCWIAATREYWQPQRVTRCLASIVALGALATPFLRLLPGLYQANLPWIALILPVHIALVLCLWTRKMRGHRPAP